MQKGEEDISRSLIERDRSVCQDSESDLGRLKRPCANTVREATPIRLKIKAREIKRTASLAQHEAEDNMQ